MTSRESADTTRLTAMLQGQRWFGAKASVVRAVALRDVIALKWAAPGTPGDHAVARVNVATDEGTSTYQIFFRRGDERWADAIDDPEFRIALARAFEHGAAFEGDGARWVVEREGGAPFTLGPHSAVALSGAQQSNSSMIIDDRAILKLFRRLEPGIQPDLEVTRFLTVDRDFDHVPALLGSIRFEDSEGATTAGLMQEYVRGAREAWSVAVAAARAHVESDVTGEPAFVREAERIGSVTRALHETLASGEPGTPFEARAASSADVRGWAATARATIAAALKALQHALAAGSVPAALRPDVDAVAGSGDRWTRWVDDLAAQIESDAGIVARTHGDYHLGQLLRSDDERYLVIDFEGEPTRPLRERRAPQSPLRDVAGMLRSFDYAAAVAGGASGAASQRASGWSEHCRAAYLRGYATAVARHDAPAIAWETREQMARIIALFECEKLFYELRYELGHRLDWLWIPLRGVAALT